MARSPIGAQLFDLARQLADPEGREAWARELVQLPGMARYLVPWLLLGEVGRTVSLWYWVERHAQKRGTATALVDDRGQVTWTALANSGRRWAARIRDGGVVPGGRVAALLPSGRELVGVLLGCAAIGASAALLDPAQPKPWLRRAIQNLQPSLLIGADTGLGQELSCPSLTVLSTEPDAVCQEGKPRFPRLVPGATAFAWLLSSGTSGEPKLCKVPLGRAILSGCAFGGIALQLRPNDVVYCPLPLHHATGLMVGLLPCLIHGTTCVVSSRFSAARFWQDVRSNGVTTIVYAGELWHRVLGQLERNESDVSTLRRVVGNGLGRRTWQRLNRLLPGVRIVEFYGATEMPGLMWNLAGLVGAMGRVPLRRLSPWVVVRRDPNTGEVLRNGTGAALTAEPGQVGELLLRIPKPHPWTPRVFEGYADPASNRGRIVRGLFQAGEHHYRTFDLVRFDSNDYFYFVDRADDGFRQAGSNVSSASVRELLQPVPGVTELAVTGVRLPGHEGRYGLLVVAPSAEFSWESLSRSIEALPNHARPRFLRVMSELPRTSSHKVALAVLVNQGVDPAVVEDGLYVWDRTHYVQLQKERWEQILENPDALW